MKVHVQGRNGVPGSVSAFNAYLGFCDMGFEVEVFDDPASLQGAAREDVVVGASGSFVLGCAHLASTAQASTIPKSSKHISAAGFGAAQSTR